MNKNRWNNIVFYTTGAILLFAGLERLQVAASGAPALALPDPLLGIPLRAAVIVIGAIELAAAAICLFARGLKLRIAIVVFLSTGYAAFWAGAILTHYHPQGTCLGSLSEPLQLAAGTSGAIISLIPVGLLLGSYSTLFLNREKKVPVKSAPQPVVGPQKMSCPACGGHIRFEGAETGKQIDCPHCKKPIALRAPEILKTACPQCAGRIEFPSHALGRKMPCPHCGAELTLTEGVRPIH